MARFESSNGVGVWYAPAPQWGTLGVVVRGCAEGLHPAKETVAVVHAFARVGGMMTLVLSRELAAARTAPCAATDKVKGAAR